MAIIFDPDPAAAAALADQVGGEGVMVHDAAVLRGVVDSRPHETLLLFGPTADVHHASDVAESLRGSRPALGVVLVRRRVDSGVLSLALRSGIREVVKSDDGDGVREACLRADALARQLLTTYAVPAASAAPTAGRVVTVFSAKGGCGKTTVATNLATAWAAARRESVCLVDLDLSFGDVAISLQLFPEHTLGDAVAMAGHVDEVGVRAMVTAHSSGLHTLLAPLEPGDAERITPALVADLMHQLKRMYDVVIVDTPPAFTEQVLAAMDVTDWFLLLATPDIPALKNLKLALEMLQMLGYAESKQQIVLNRADAKVGLTIADVERALKRRVAATIPSSRDVPAAVNRGVPLAMDQPSHPVSAAIRSLGAVMTGAPAETRQPAAAAPRSRHARKVSLLRRGDVPA